MKGTTIIVLIAVAISTFFIVDNFRFPVKYKICKIGYIDCSTTAKFKDMNGCQMANERGGWYCNQTDPNDIKCRVGEPGESIAVGLCTD